MAPESLLYLPLNLHLGADSAKTYAPMLPAVPLTDSGLSAYVLIATLGSLKQGLYVLDGNCWRFTMPQPILSDILIRGSVVDVYLGLNTPITVSPNAVVYKNGILFDQLLLEGNSIFCVLNPGGTGETSIYLKAVQNLSGHRVLKAVVGGADYASRDVVGDAQGVIGLSTGAAAAGEFIEIQTDGELTEPSWNWTVGLPVFNDLNGMLTQTSPSSGYSLVVGIATEPTTILISLKQPIVLN